MRNLSKPKQPLLSISIKFTNQVGMFALMKIVLVMRNLSKPKQPLLGIVIKITNQASIFALMKIVYVMRILFQQKKISHSTAIDPTSKKG